MQEVLLESREQRNVLGQVDVAQLQFKLLDFVQGGDRGVSFIGC
jgi:hypothetical protein